MAYRVRDRYKTAEFLNKTMGYRIDPDLPDGFSLKFEDGTTTDCLVLLPEENKTKTLDWIFHTGLPSQQAYHIPPEVFVSDGGDGSIVGEWVKKMNNGVGGIHHLAYQVDSVQAVMDQMIKDGMAEFTSIKPIECDGLVQVFTKPSPYTGIIYEFISRGIHGFCKDSVKDLMKSTKDFSQ